MIAATEIVIETQGQQALIDRARTDGGALAALADRLGCSRQTLMTWISGKASPRGGARRAAVETAVELRPGSYGVRLPRSVVYRYGYSVAGGHYLDARIMTEAIRAQLPLPRGLQPAVYSIAQSARDVARVGAALIEVGAGTVDLAREIADALETLAACHRIAERPTGAGWLADHSEAIRVVRDRVRGAASPPSPASGPQLGAEVCAA